MVKRVLLLTLLAGLSAQAQFVTGRFTTSFYGWQGRNDTYDRQDYLRGYESVQLDVTKGLFSINTNFQASKDFGTIIGTDPELRLSLLTLRARNLAGLLDVSAGRQFVYAGVGNGLMDGGEVKLSLFDSRVHAVAYGGYNVIQSRTINLRRSFPENSLYGGQITAEPVDNGVVGISYMRRTRKPDPFTVVRADSLFNPYVVVIAYSPLEEEYTSLDARYTYGTLLSVYGRGDYDMNFERVSRVEGYARVSVLEGLGITADYLFREPRIAYNSIFSVFASNSTQEIEGGVDYQVMPLLRTFVRYGYVKYTDDNSQRLTAGATYDFVSLSYTQNFGYAGDLNGVSVTAAYPFMERKLVPNFGFGYASYQYADDAPKNNVLSSSAGLTYRPLPELSGDVLFQWMRSPLYKSDGRIFVKLSYWFGSELGIL